MEEKNHLLYLKLLKSAGIMMTKKKFGYFSVVDIVAALTDQKDFQKAQSYWTTLKNRLKKEGSEIVTNCDKLKMLSADGKKYFTDVADVETILRRNEQNVHISFLQLNHAL